ncbi:MAG: hypothetical protein ACYDGR_07660 [Candidatus Dormibacteria bacterium]
MRAKDLSGGRVRLALGSFAFAPAVSLLAARAVAAAVGATGLRALPVGLHTYVPLADVVDVRLLGLGSILLALIGFGLVIPSALRRRSDAVPAWLRSLARLAAAAVLMQVVLYVLQALVVAQLQGLPDAWPAISLAVAIHAGVGATAAISIVMARLLLPYLPRLVLGTAIQGLRLRRTAISEATNRCSATTRPPRRGPPVLLPASS